MSLEPKPGFDWARIRWSGPTAPVDETCSYCGATIPDDDECDYVPLRLWKQAGAAAAVFCDACMRTWWGIEIIPDDDGDRCA